MGSEMPFLMQALATSVETVLWGQLSTDHTKLLCEAISLQAGRSAIGASL